MAHEHGQWGKNVTEKESAAAHFASLIRAVAQERNRESFVELFDYFAPRVKSFLMRGGTSEDTADELAQETMLAVWNKADAYDPARAAPSTWIYTIARNKKIDALRKTGRFEIDDSDPSLLRSEGDAPSQHLMDTQDTDAIAAALETLPGEQSDLLYKSFFEDKSHQEIAAETGIPLGTVKSRIRLALERLRKNEKVGALWH